jgi:hypothetical protein
MLVVEKDDQESNLGYFEFEVPLRHPWLMLSRKNDAQLWSLGERHRPKL